MIERLIKIVSFTISLFVLKKCLHIYQLKGYFIKRYLKFFSKIHVVYMFFNVFLLIICSILKFSWLYTMISLLDFLFTIYIHINLIKSKKSPLIFTPKAKRIYILSIFLSLLLHISKFGNIIFSITSFILIPLANFLNIFDKIKNKRFIKSAQQKLKNSKVRIIAITGSNGKTSVKNILFQLLHNDYKTIASPKSFNTPIGLSKFINDELKADTEFVILEFGAREIGNIKNLCKTFGADVGIITSICPQHIATFKTIDNIVKEKNELALFLNCKPCVYNIDSEYLNKLYINKQGKKISISQNNFADIYATSISTNYMCSKFTINYNNEKFNLKTKLIGSHNITNILLALGACSALNIRLKNISKKVLNLKPIEHRLQYIKSNFNILDDSYNCSIESAKHAINIFNTTPNRKMIVTPGIIEGGLKQFELNFALGKIISHLDYCVLVGSENRYALMSGILDSNRNAKIIYAKNLEEATKNFSLLSSNDSILFLNDLPDDYK